MKTMILLMAITISVIFLSGCADKEPLPNLGAAPLSDQYITNAINADNKVVVALFLYPGGAPCQQQQVYLNNLQAKYGNSLVVINYPVNDVASRQAMSDYLIETVPTTVIIDDDGYIVQKYTTLTDDSKLDRTISQLV
ncbi:MAG: hypothetical protein M8349_05000 [ANME-2 cluster archaeon]|nr:hypothetical protein [ANME-2 cluster archaeon]